VEQSEGGVTVNEAIAILTLINTLEPAAIALVKTFLTSLSGKTTAEILAEADSTWQSIIDEANNQLNPPQP